MVDLHVVRVFVGPGGSGGNALGVVLDGPAVPEDRRLAIANRLGFSETVFVDDQPRGRLRIFTPARELPFAGHPLVGTAWLLASIDRPVSTLRPPAGDVFTWSEGNLRWIRGRAEWVFPMAIEQLRTAAEVDALQGPPAGPETYYAWAWEDEAAGRVRSRFFASEFDNVEDEATGAAAVVLGRQVGRPIEIRQGRGSRLLARPGPDGTTEVGGAVELVEVRPLE